MSYFIAIAQIVDIPLFILNISKFLHFWKYFEDNFIRKTQRFHNFPVLLTVSYVYLTIEESVTVTAK